MVVGLRVWTGTFTERRGNLRMRVVRTTRKISEIKCSSGLARPWWAYYCGELARSKCERSRSIWPISCMTIIDFDRRDYNVCTRGLARNRLASCQSFIEG